MNPKNTLLVILGVAGGWLPQEHIGVIIAMKPTLTSGFTGWS